MTSLEKIIFIGIVTLCLNQVGNCQTRYWTPFGYYTYSASRCANGKCAVQNHEAKEEAEPQIIEVKPFCQRVIDLVNAQRLAAGLPTLTLDETLCQGCDSHSRYMRSNGFGHAYGIGGRECIAYGVATPEAVVNLWLGSSGHRAIILGGGSKIGVGFSGAYWTLRIR